MNSEEHKARVRQLLKQHDYQSAVELLDSMIAEGASKDDESAAWAREQRSRVKRAVDNYRKNRGPALHTAKRLVERHDYRQAAELLGKFPQPFRTKEMHELLATATERQQEVERLIAEINRAVENRERDGLLEKVERLLKLNPGHRQAQRLHERLTSKRELAAPDYKEGLLSGLGGEFYRWRKWLVSGTAVVLLLIGVVLLRPGDDVPPRQGSVTPRVAQKPPVEPAPVEPPRLEIRIDGQFDDWDLVPAHVDPSHDEHVTKLGESGEPELVDHPDVDLVEFKVTSDESAIFFYVRSRGEIGRTFAEPDPDQATSEQSATSPTEPAPSPGRYYVNLSIDVDGNDETGYSLEEGNYYPVSRGYDVSAEIEFFNGRLNQVRCLHYGATDPQQLEQALSDLTGEKYSDGNPGPYPAGFVRLGPGSYDHSSEWVYHEDGTITLVEDKGATTIGAATAAVSDDGHQIEARFPFAAFLKDELEQPVIAAGRVLDLSFTLEASGELAPAGEWASDTGEMIPGYVVEPPAGAAAR